MGTSPLDELKYQVHLRALRYRSMDRLIHHPNLEQAFKDEPDHLKKVLAKGNVQELRRLIKKYEKKTFVELLAEARSKKIKNYGRKSKKELMKELGYV